jgi:predicted ribosome quality control (RQC) complex YloA/Tae2 family protein
LAFDGVALSAVTNELQELVGSRIEKIYQPEPSCVLLHLHTRQNRCKLLLSSHPVNGRVHLTKLTYTNPLHPPLFCMILRKHLEGGKLVSVTQGENLERSLTISVEVLDELGDLTIKQIILEIMGRHSNLILVEPEKGIIIDGIKRYTHAVSRYREVLPGRKYLAPPSQDKLNLLEVKEEQFKEALFSSPLHSPIYKLFVNSLGGISTSLAKELVESTGLPLELTLNSIGDYEFSLLWQKVSCLARIIRNKNYNPTVYSSFDEPIDFTAISFSPQEAKKKTKSLCFSTMSLALDYFYEKQITHEKVTKAKHSLLKILNKELQRNYKKRIIQEETVTFAEEAKPFRIAGELLTANLYRLEKGLAEITVENFYDANNSLITIPLKKELTPAENAQLYFKKYNKAKIGAKKAKQQLLLTLTEIEYLESVVQSIEQADLIEEIEDIKQELIKEGYLKQPVVKKGKSKNTTKSKTKFLTYLSSKGFKILVGKNNRQNDLLTLKVAKDHDLWFHVKDIPGSHVIVQTNEQEVPDSTIKEAALIAAFYSKGQSSSQVPVDWTQKKHVKKPNGAKPGKVIYENHKTIFITPDKELLESLQKMENK